MSLSEETLALQRAAHELMYLGMDGSPIYSDCLLYTSPSPRDRG